MRHIQLTASGFIPPTAELRTTPPNTFRPATCGADRGPGLVCNGGSVLPAHANTGDPNGPFVLDNHLAVQFIHRMVAYLLLGLSALHTLDCAYHDHGRAGAIALACVLVVQATVGILTLLWHVPIVLALVHQSVGILALIVARGHAASLRAAPALAAPTSGDTPRSFTSVGGITGTVNLNVTPNAFQGLVQQCCVGITGNFNGGFTPGDKVLVTYQAPLTINFNTPVQSVGTQIQDDRIGDHFIAEILACRFRRIPARYSDLMPAGIPI